VIPYSEYIWGDKFKAAFPDLFFKTEQAVTADCLPPCVITHNSDLPIDEIDAGGFVGRRWFGQNICTDDERFVPIPIGLENDYVGGSVARKDMLHHATTFPDQTAILCYLNFGYSHPERHAAFNYFQGCGFCKLAKQGDYGRYISDILNHQFVVCPRGNGLDCHRNWEVLYLGRYPVMKRMHSLEYLFHGLPVLFVDEWQDVTEELLRNVADSFGQIEWNWDKLKFSYWEDLIRKEIA